MTKEEQEAADCPPKSGGCPCVQPDGDPGLPTKYRVRRVIRVEDEGSLEVCSGKGACQAPG